MLLRCRLAPVRGARSHVVDEFVILLREPMLLTLAVERDLGPLERAVGIAAGAGAVLLACRHLHALGVANGARALDLAADLLLVSVAQAAAVCVLDVIGERMKAMAVGFQQARDGTQCSKGLALTAGGQQADRFAKLGGELVWERHGLFSALPPHSALVE